MLGRTLESVVGSDLRSLAPPEQQEPVRVLLAAAEARSADLALLHRDGRRIPVAVSVRPVQDPGEELRCVVVVDLTSRHEHELELLAVAHHDSLTGLLNRRGFELALAEHLAHVGRPGGDGALILFDVDHFKYINDTRGHRVGDEALQRVARAVASRLRATDVLARLGGDEFAVLLPAGDRDEAAGVAEALVATARTVDLDALGLSRPLTISVGVVLVGGVDPTADDLLALADVAMYDSKEQGRDRVTFHAGAGAHRGAGSGVGWLSRIEGALADRALLLDAQPIVDLRTGQVVRHELLVRLPVASGRAAAVTWFPVAERYGLAPAIDRWVVDQALDLLRRGAFSALSVNASATSVGDEGWRAHVFEGIRASQVDPRCLTFEITETAAIRNMGAAARLGAELRSAGCRLALDDFGAGFGSFYYLKHLPFDEVKIDGEFVRACTEDERDRAIIRSMVDVATSTGRTTVAESTESAAAVALLRDHGVDMAQGFQPGPPIPVHLDDRGA
jgi:diguanylate cyclase (GGDEF)-like protein